MRKQKNNPKKKLKKEIIKGIKYQIIIEMKTQNSKKN